VGRSVECFALSLEALGPKRLATPGPRWPPRGLAPAHSKNDVRPGFSGVGRLRASLSRDFDTDLCNTIPTRGHACEPSILFRARLLAPVHVGPAEHDLRRTSKSRRAMPSAVLFRTVPRGRRAVPFGAGSKAYGLACWEKRGAHQHC
jgi:hypothetical protein